MKSNILIFGILLITLLGACKNQDNTALAQRGFVPEGGMSHNNDCKILFKILISNSSLKNPFIDSLDISIDKKYDDKVLIRLFDQSDVQENAVGWLVFDAKNKKLLDITNDSENPVPLGYDMALWNGVIACYFDSNKNYQLGKTEQPQCNEIDTPTEYDSREECFFTNTSIQNIYKKTIKDAAMAESKWLLPNLPLSDTYKDINQNGLISIDYKISPQVVEIEFLYGGGVTSLTLEQRGKDVKRIISYSAD